MTWKGERQRHALASRGIVSKTKDVSNQIQENRKEYNLLSQDDQIKYNMLKIFGFGHKSCMDFAISDYISDDSAIWIDAFFNIDEDQRESFFHFAKVFDKQSNTNIVDEINDILNEEEFVHPEDDYGPGYDDGVWSNRVSPCKCGSADCPDNNCLRARGFIREWNEGNKRVMLFDSIDDARGLIRQLERSNKQWRGGYAGGGYTLEIIEEGRY